MNAGGRYQSQALYLHQSDISCYRGVDPLTGLAVLIYTFPGRPTVDVGGLESENIPGILASSHDDAVGQVVSAYSPHYRPLAAGDAVIDDRLVLEVLRGVRDAARAGVVHGDLRAGRLLHAQSHVLIEGYGVPWSPVEADATAPEVAAGAAPGLPADVYAIAATLLVLAGDRMSNAVNRTLRTALAHDPADRPTASALFALVRRASAGAVTNPARSFDELTLPTAATDGARPPGGEGAVPGGDDGAERTERTSLSATRSDFQLDLDFELEVAAPAAGTGAAGARADPPANARPKERQQDEPEPITLNSDPGVKPAGAGATRPKNPTFVKAPPPGATYRAGTIDETVAPAPIRLDLPPAHEPPRRSWRGPLVLLLVLVVGGGLAALAFLRQGGLAPAPTTSSGVDYIVTVQVSPSNLPPVDLYVVKSPPGSSTPAGTIICRAPCKVVLDRQGDWQFVGQFQNQRSKPADVTLPGQRNVTVTFAGNAAQGRTSQR